MVSISEGYGEVVAPIPISLVSKGWSKNFPRVKPLPFSFALFSFLLFARFQQLKYTKFGLVRSS